MSPPQLQVSVDEVWERAHELCRCSDKMSLLNDTAITIDGVRVIGSTLWSHVPKCMTIAGNPKKGTSTVEYQLNDYRKIHLPKSKKAKLARDPKDGQSNPQNNPLLRALSVADT